MGPTILTIFSLDGVEPQLPAGFCFIAQTAALIGNVSLGEDASIWFGVVIRGDNENIAVGARSNIQDNCVLHTDPGYPIAIGEGCTIGHNAIIHGCKIGDNSLIGMGATILNGAVIGKNCLIGAGALVTSGQVVADNSMVLGAPGKVKRMLDEEAIEDNRRAANGYVERARRFSKGLQAI